MDKKVSIIVPVYNTEKYLDKCLNSLLNQSYKNIEIIFVNDGSTDRSKEILQKYARQSEKIIVVEQKNQGLSVARNEGILHATGFYLSFVDGDDYVDKDFIFHLIERAEDSRADMVICGYKMVDEKGKVLRKTIPDVYERITKEEWSCRIMAACFRLIKKELWDAYDMKFMPGIWGEDLAVVLFLNSMCEKIEVLSCAEYYYVQHASSIRHNMKGIARDKMPYQAIEDTCMRITELQCKNSKFFLELSLLKIFTVLLFDLGRGADDTKIKELCEYIQRIMETYFPDWKKTVSLRKILAIKFPIIMKFEIAIFYLLLKTNLTYRIGRVYCYVFK